MEEGITKHVSRILLPAICVGLFSIASAQAPAVPGTQQAPEEIIVTGERLKFQLRLQMLEAESAAYALFNQFNADDRFEISCSVQQATGSRMKEDTLHCQPEFEIQAHRAHSRDYLESLRLFYDGSSIDKNAPIASQPFAAVIAAHQREYRDPLKRVAEEHPEFLQALVKYSELKSQYEAAR